MRVVGERIKKTNTQFKDSKFDACDQFVYGECAAAWRRVVGEVTWKRPAEISGRGKHAPFVEKISTTAIAASDIVKESAPHLHFCISMLASYPKILERVININYAEYGMYAVSLHYEGEWHAVIVDDRIPCYVPDEDDRVLPRFCRGAISTDPRGRV